MNKLRLPLTCLYLVFFTLYSLMTRFTWTAARIDGSINVWMYRSLLIFGCLLAIWWLIASRREIISSRKKTDFFFWAGFVAVLCVSTLINYSYQLSDNLYGIVTFGFQLVLFYLMGRTLTDQEWDGIIKKIILCCSALWDIACAASLMQFLFNISYITQYASDRGAVRQGITDGRLFGLFSDPNFAAFTSLLLVAGLWHIISSSKNPPAIRIFVWISIALNTMYIIMSNSRTVYLSVIGTVLFYVLLTSYKKFQAQEKTGLCMLRHLIIRSIITLVFLLVIYFATLISLRGIAEVISPDRNTAEEMVREDVNAENISNNRFTIWQAYFELYKEKPLFGFSTRGALPYATANHPDSYLAETQYVTHNGYLSLLVETGAVGFCVMAAFMLLLFIRSIGRIRDKKPVSSTYILFSSWLAAIMIFCICFHDIFFTLNLETMLFYSGLGFLWQKQFVD